MGVRPRPADGRNQGQNHPADGLATPFGPI